MKRKAKIFYTELNDFWRKEEKLAWLSDNPISKIDFQRIEPDEKHNWINQTDNDFESLLSLLSDKGEGVFNLFGNTIKSNRDEWVYDFNKESLISKMEFFSEKYNKQLKTNSYDLSKLDTSIKWSRDLRNKLESKYQIDFSLDKVTYSQWRPFTKKHFYSEKIMNDVLTTNHYQAFGTNFNQNNIAINFSDANTTKPFSLLATSQIADYHFISDTKFTTLYRYDSENQKYENITDWALNRFREHYKKSQGSSITKENIFYYVYAVLHSPFYRAKYEQNLKREFPRIPFYEDFFQWRDWGKALMDLHINYETQEPFTLKRTDAIPTVNKKDKTPNLFDNCLKDNDSIASGANPTLDVDRKTVPERDESPINDSSLSAKEDTTDTSNGLHPLLLNSSASPTASEFVPKIKTKLRAGKAQGIIEIDSETTLSGIPALAWEYKLGNRSAIEWILDQYKEKTPQDATIRERFNTYKFADYKEKVIDLLKRVTTVSIKTMEIVNSMTEK